mmetsp:Transcript_29050/g.59406  ORF Transcript_29050/g.59406 Transcript_29050/m.59406 type:complete len:389 (+) Transcript_29050:245-1411(+)
MPDRHALVVAQESEQSPVLDQRRVILVVVGIISDLTLDGLDHGRQNGRLVRGRYGSGVIELGQRFAPRVLRGHLHETKVFQHFHRVPIGVAGEIDGVVRSRPFQERDLLVGEGILLDAVGGASQLFQGLAGAGFDGNRNVHGIVRIAFQGEAVQEQEFGVRLGTVGDVNLFHLPVPSVGVQDHLLLSGLEEPIARLARVDVRAGEGTVIDEVGVRDHGEGLAGAEVAKAYGAGEEHGEGPLPGFVGEFVAGEAVGEAVAEAGGLVAEEGVVLPAELGLEGAGGGNDGTAVQEGQVLVGPGEGRVDLLDVRQDVQVRLVLRFVPQNVPLVNQLTRDREVFVDAPLQRVPSQRLPRRFLRKAQVHWDLQQFVTLVDGPSRQQAPSGTFVR